MPINMTVRMQGVWRRVGMRAQVHTYTFQDPEWRLKHARGPQLGVYFCWPRTASFLRLRAWHGGPSEVSFGAGRDALCRTFEQLNVPYSFGEEYLEQHHFLAAIL